VVATACTVLGFNHGFCRVRVRSGSIELRLLVVRCGECDRELRHHTDGVTQRCRCDRVRSPQILTLSNHELCRHTDDVTQRCRLEFGSTAGWTDCS
jgi:hypothetical protein